MRLPFVLLVLTMIMMSLTGVEGQYIFGPKWFKLVRQEIKRVFAGKNNQKQVDKTVDEIQNSLPGRFLYRTRTEKIKDSVKAKA